MPLGVLAIAGWPPAARRCGCCRPMA